MTSNDYLLYQSTRGLNKRSPTAGDLCCQRNIMVNLWGLSYWVNLFACPFPSKGKIRALTCQETEKLRDTVHAAVGQKMV